VLNESDRSLLAGFGDPVTFADLRAAHHRGPPKEPGVYVAIYPFGGEPQFLPKGSGGIHKDRDPNVSIDELRERWVQASRLLYFGKAGGSEEKAHLRKRISAYSRVGLGKKASHWGGRLIWQIPESELLLICWKKTPGEEPRQVETRLIQRFVAHYCKLPFANLCG
jgi:hypothetical protein